MASKHGLGRGLGALIPETDLAEADRMDNPEARTDGVRMAAVGSLSPNPDQPRRRFDQASIDELALSVSRHGVIQPLIVEADGDGRYRIIAGERRWRAACQAGLKEVPVLVREMGREKRLEVALVENIQREDLNPADEAEAYRQLMEAIGLTQEQVAERVGKSRPAVANSLRLLSLPPEAMEALRSGSISAGHARAILSALNPGHRSAILSRILQDGISVREAEALAAGYNKGIAPAGTAAAPASAQHNAAKPGAKPGAKPLDPDLAALEQNLIGTLGTKVSIKGDNERGSIIIEYFSMEDLERVYGIIAGQE